MVGALSGDHGQVREILRRRLPGHEVVLVAPDDAIDWLQDRPLPAAALLDANSLVEASHDLLRSMGSILTSTRIVVAAGGDLLQQAASDVPLAVALVRTPTDPVTLAGTVAQAASDLALSRLRPITAGSSRRRVVDYLSALHILIWSASERLQEQNDELTQRDRATAQDLQEMAEIVRALGLIIVSQDVHATRSR